jgi:DNA phosphorothioation-dependent restriction protein DptG
MRPWCTRRRPKSEPAEDEGCLVVLSLRKDYVLLWTTSCVDRDHQVRKLLSEYKEAGAFTVL